MNSELESLNWVAIHCRGVLNTGHGNVLARTLATAGTLGGRESYYYMRYDDSPERDNIPLIFYVVFGNPKVEVTLPEEVEPIGNIFNVIVVMEPTLMLHQTSQRAQLFEGAKKDAILIVNTSLPSEDVGNVVKKHSLTQEWTGKLVTLSASTYDRNIAYPLLAAVAKVWKVVDLENILLALDSLGMRSKVSVVEKVYNDLTPIDVRLEPNQRARKAAEHRVGYEPHPVSGVAHWDLKTYRQHQKMAADAKSYVERINAMPRWETLAPGLIEFGPDVGKKNVGFRTSFARYVRPVVAKDKCTNCKMCTLYCPDGCIDFNLIDVDLEYCKGCGICAEVCPSKAIAMISEMKLEEGLCEKEVVSIEDALIEYGY